MNSIEIFNKIFNKNPILGRALISQVKNWPTSPSNLKKNCKIFEQLNKADLEIDKDLSNECYEILCVSAYIRKALIQRGLMNIQYYILLDEAMRTQLEQNNVVSKGGRNQVGGIGLSQLLAKIGLAFALLGSSEGIESPSAVVNSDSPSVLVNSDSSMVFSPPVEFASTKEDIQKNRMILAEKQMNELVTDKNPWILPETTITIAKGVTEGQIDFFRTTMEELNSKLASSSRDATVMCGQISSRASNLNVFSNEAFVQQVLTFQDELTAESKQKRTSDIIQDKSSFVTRGALAVATKAAYGMLTGTSSPEITLDNNAIMKQAYDKAVAQINEGRTGQVESLTYSQGYKELCKATPRPRFEVSVDESPGGAKNLVVKTSFGNMNTGQLLLIHIETIGRIKIMLKDPELKEQNKKVLESLSERTEMEISLIESSTLFAPLDGTVPMPGASLFTGFIADSTVATSNFEEIVKQIATALPLSGANADALLDIQRSAFEIRQNSRNQAAAEWKTYLSDATKVGTSILTDAVGNVAIGTAEAANIVLDSASGLAQNVLTSSGDVVGTAVDEASKVVNIGVDEIGVLANKGMDIAGDVVEKTSETAANLIYTLLPAAIALLGVGGAAAWIVIWFKKNMFSFGNGTAQQQQQQLQQLQEQLRGQQELQQQLQQIIMQQQQQQVTTAPQIANAPAAAVARNNGSQYGPHGEQNYRRFQNQEEEGEEYNPNQRYGGKRKRRTKTRKNKKNKTRKMKGGKRRQTKHRKNRQTKKR